MAERIQGENHVVLSGMIGMVEVYRKAVCVSVGKMSRVKQSEVLRVFPESNNDGNVEVVDRAAQPYGL